MGTPPMVHHYQTEGSQAAAERMQTYARSHYDPDRRAQRSVEGRHDDFDVAGVAVAAMAYSSFNDGGNDGGSSSSD